MHVAGVCVCVCCCPVAPTEMVQRKARFFFGDLSCKWYPYALKLAENIKSLLEEDSGAIPLKIRKLLLLTPEALSSMQPVTSAVHSLAHIWYCQVRLLCIHLLVDRTIA